ncbi:hypothetical protein EPUS_03264 [Endocarpon pusillum Z07020]|uniref:Uncharacterized protein n=1 Tax=Endocarpon pusillum (strain Z07020 / HMAS-L-300199) TaxID=1263415 RepID=U1HVX9_ENDPU|nr:uncharacterized protein EPUS_03264 [Endocarpon pusillum Z07020]ERF74880.1 hypothetical protein EPUS_03264 [Endocarpon pusillum Z07020]
MDPVSATLLIGGATVTTMAAVGIGTITAAAVGAGAAVKTLRNEKKRMKLQQEQAKQATQRAELEMRENKIAMGQHPNQSSLTTHSPHYHQPQMCQQAAPPALPYGGYQPYAAPPMVPYYVSYVPVQHGPVQHVPPQLAPSYSGHGLPQHTPQSLGGLGQQYLMTRPTQQLALEYDNDRPHQILALEYHGAKPETSSSKDWT